MAESCLPCSCSSCGCSTQYHFVHPSLATFNKPHPRSAESSQLPGKPSPAETSHDSPGWGRRDWRKGWRCGFGPVRSPGCNRPLALPQHTTPSLTHTRKMHKATVHFYTQRDTHACTQAREEKEGKRQKRIPKFAIQSYHLNQCACD